MSLVSAVLILISAGGVLAGLFLFLNPALSIQIQKKFYEKINWRIEPISMPREIRNTKIMGLLLTIISFITASYILIAILTPQILKCLPF
jgi:hypothetical protein